MKKIAFIIFTALMFIYTSLSKQNISMIIHNSGNDCTEAKIFIIDSNNDDLFDMFFFFGCNNQMFSCSLTDKSHNYIGEYQTAYLSDGNIDAKNFIILIYDPNSFSYTHKLYFDNKISKAVLEDYTDNGSEPSTYEEADNYFYTQQMGSTLLITKKTDIDVQSVYLCSLDGIIITNLQNVEGWSQFSFDLSLEPSGMYLLRFISRDRAMTKRIVYLR